jgi:hypothetical protein
MQHTIDELLKKIQAMHDLAILAHREKYKKAPGQEYNVAHVTHLVDQIQALAGDIYNDKTIHPKLKEKLKNG